MARYYRRSRYSRDYRRDAWYWRRRYRRGRQRNFRRYRGNYYKYGRWRA